MSSLLKLLDVEVNKIFVNMYRYAEPRHHLLALESISSFNPVLNANMVIDTTNHKQTEYVVDYIYEGTTYTMLTRADTGSIVIVEDADCIDNPNHEFTWLDEKIGVKKNPRLYGNSGIKTLEIDPASNGCCTFNILSYTGNISYNFYIIAYKPKDMGDELYRFQLFRKQIMHDKEVTTIGLKFFKGTGSNYLISYLDNNIGDGNREMDVIFYGTNDETVITEHSELNILYEIGNKR